MRTLLRSLLWPWLGIVAGAAVLGFGVNAVRARDRIELARAYFTAAPASDAPGPRPGQASATAIEPTPRSIDSPLASRARQEFRVLDAREARALFETAQRRPGHVVFVDARNDAHYHAGHVPGAVQIDYFNLAADLEPHLAWLKLTPWIVVYCESETCDDGLSLCRALRRNHGIPADKILLFIGGMREWRALGLPRTKGGGPWSAD